MEVLSRFFQRKSFSLCSSSKGHKNEPKLRDGNSFGPDSVRLVVFRDHDLNGRSLKFDSKAMHRIGDSQISSRRKSKDGGTGAASTGQPPPDGSSKHTPMRQLSDTDMIGEMMFGSVAMAYKGSTLKIHTIRSPPQVIITNIFVPVKMKDTSNQTPSESESFDNGSYQSTSSIYTYESSTPRDMSSVGSSGPHSAPVMSASVPVAVPSPPPPRSLDELPAADTGDSGIAGSVTSSYSSHTTPYASPGSSCSTESNSYIHRRFLRSRNTSLELHVRTKLSDGAVEKPLPASKRPPQYGIGIVFSMPEEQDEQNRHFQSFLFSHIMLIEGHVKKLRVTLEKALKIKGFQLAVLESLDVFRKSVFDLYLAQRLVEPVWLNMMSSKLQKVTLCKTFLKEFMISVDKYNTKNTKMFLSSLVTAVLRHHLAWVPTVAPAGATPSRPYLDKHSAKWLDALAKSHPYNPLWAQLGDLYGAIGFPLRLSRTVVIGKKQDVIKRFVYILSYFIRCSEVYETIHETPDAESWHLDSLVTTPENQRSSEISIPNSSHQDSSSKEGSLKSPNSNSGFQHASYNSCSQCGSVIENVQYNKSSSHQSPRARIPSFNRIKSPSPVFESGETVDTANNDFNRTRIRAFLSYKNRTSGMNVKKVDPAVQSVASSDFNLLKSSYSACGDTDCINIAESSQEVGSLLDKTLTETDLQVSSSSGNDPCEFNLQIENKEDQEKQESVIKDMLNSQSDSHLVTSSTKETAVDEIKRSDFSIDGDCDSSNLICMKSTINTFNDKDQITPTDTSYMVEHLTEIDELLNEVTSDLHSDDNSSTSETTSVSVEPVSTLSGTSLNDEKTSLSSNGPFESLSETTRNLNVRGCERVTSDLNLNEDIYTPELIKNNVNTTNTTVISSTPNGREEENIILCKSCDSKKFVNKDFVEDDHSVNIDPVLPCVMNANARMWFRVKQASAETSSSINYVNEVKNSPSVLTDPDTYNGEGLLEGRRDTVEENHVYECEDAQKMDTDVVKREIDVVTNSSLVDNTENEKIIRELNKVNVGDLHSEVKDSEVIEHLHTADCDNITEGSVNDDSSVLGNEYKEDPVTMFTLSFDADDTLRGTASEDNVFTDNEINNTYPSENCNTNMYGQYTNAFNAASRFYSESSVVQERRKLYPSLDINRVGTSDSELLGNKCARQEFLGKENFRMYPDLKMLKKIEGLATPEDSPEKIIFPVTESGLNSTSESYAQNALPLAEANKPGVFIQDSILNLQETSKLPRVKLGANSEESSDLFLEPHGEMDESTVLQTTNLSPKKVKYLEPIEEVKVVNVGLVRKESVITPEGDNIPSHREFNLSELGGNSINGTKVNGLSHRDSGLGTDSITGHSPGDYLHCINNKAVCQRIKECSEDVVNNEVTNKIRSSGQVDSGIFDQHTSSYDDNYTNISIQNDCSIKVDSKAKSRTNSTNSTTIPVIRSTSSSKNRRKHEFKRSISKDSQSSIMENYGNVACPDMQELDKFVQCIQHSPEDDNELDHVDHQGKFMEKAKYMRMRSGDSEFDEYFTEEESDISDSHHNKEENTINDSSFPSTVSTPTTPTYRGVGNNTTEIQSSTSSTNESVKCFAMIGRYKSAPTPKKSTDYSKLLPQDVDKSILLDRIAPHPASDSDCNEEFSMSTNSSLGSDESISRIRGAGGCGSTGLGSGTDDTSSHGSRLKKFEEMCSTSVTGSDMDESMCSECTLRTDRSSSFSVTAKHRRPSFRRQTSMPSTGTPGRCRSVTPTELNRRRHASSTGGHDHSVDIADAMATSQGSNTGHEHLPMPGPNVTESKEQIVPTECNFGHSLLADYSPHYLSDFTLHGTSDTAFHTRLHQDLMMSVQNPVLDEQIAETACVVADTDKWSVKVLRCHYNASDRVQTEEMCASKLVSDIIDSVYNLWKLKMSPEFCLMHLEDRLQEVYFKSKMLSEYMKVNRKMDLKELATILGFDPSDLPLLLAVAGTHTPALVLGLIG